jgi:hypothetical protein
MLKVAVHFLFLAASLGRMLGTTLVENVPAAAESTAAVANPGNNVVNDRWEEKGGNIVLSQVAVGFSREVRKGEGKWREGKGRPWWFGMGMWGEEDNEGGEEGEKDALKRAIDKDAGQLVLIDIVPRFFALLCFPLLNILNI